MSASRGTGVAIAASVRPAAAITAAIVRLCNRRPMPEILACGTGKKKTERSAFQRFRGHDLDPETTKAHVSALGGGQQADRGNPEVLQDLGAKPDFAPLPGAGRIRFGIASMRDFSHRNAGRTVAQIDDDAAPVSLEALE